MQLSANSVKLLSGGNVIKQGDQTPLTFELFDEQGNLVELQEATVKVKIANNQIVLLEKTTTINPDNTVSFSLSKDDVLGNGKMRLEFSVTYANSIVEKFPAEGWQEIMITPTLDDLSAGNVAVITIEQFEQRINTAVTEANTATTAANNAANTANQVAQDVSEATTAANNAASNANTAANAANTAAISANDAAAAANASAGEAETAATNATNASDAANTASNAANLASIAASDAADLANTAASNADAATNSATTAAENANTATTAANNAAVNTQAIVDNTKFIEIYNPLTQYKKNNIVSLNGSSFIAKRDTMGNTPIGDASDLNWGLIAQRGVDGTGSVSTVNNIPPDENGNVEITIPDPDLSGYETVTGAQEKADAAEANAIAWGKSYGLGTVSKTLSSVDLDGVAENGLYYASAVSNRPIAENGYLIVQVLSSVYSAQKYITATSNREFRRINNNGTWSAWEEIIGSEEFTQFQDDVALHQAEDAIHVAGGTANAIAISTSQNYAYTQHKRLSFKAVTDNTGNVTIDVDGKGAMPALKFDGTQLAAGSIKAGKVYDFYYDTANGGRFFLIAKASGNATAGDVLAGKTASGDDGEFIGSMPNNGAVTITPGSTNKVIPTGYHNGAGIVSGDADLVAGNIKSGINIFGVTGTLNPMRPGDTVVISNTSSLGTTSTNMTKMKEVQVHTGGQYRIKFSMWHYGNNSQYSYAQIYVNGVAKGVLRSTNSISGEVQFTEDMVINGGDAVQIFARSGNGHQVAIGNMFFSIELLFNIYM
ncbi:MAG: pyocin knob domain-containing protein [Bacillota bacterium]